jgi:hypothetical protein
VDIESEPEVVLGPTIRIDGQSFLRLVLPIALSSDQLEQRSRRIEDQTDMSGARMWKLSSMSVSDFLPHIADHLRLGSQDSPSSSTLGSLWELERAKIGDADLLANAWSCKLPANSARESSEVAFRVSSSFLAIFRPGMAFAILHISPMSTSLDAWLDLRHYLRFYLSGRSRKVGLLGRPYDMTIADLIAPIVDSALLEGEAFPSTLAQALPEQSYERLRRADIKPAREPFTPGEFLTYSTFFVDDYGPGQKDERELLARIEGGFHSLQGRDLTSEDGGLEHPYSRIAYQAHQTFILTLESSSFVAFNPPNNAFTNENLPDHLEKTYFLMFLLVHLQRFALIGLSARIVTTTTNAVQPDNEANLRGQLANVVQLDRGFLEFTARSYYLQVSQQYHHHRYYDSMRKLNQIESLYAEINNEISSLKAFVNSLVQQEADRRSNLVQIAVMVITAIFVPAGVLLTLFSQKIRSWPGIDALSPTESLSLTLIVLLILVGSMLTLHALYRRASRGRDALDNTNSR